MTVARYLDTPVAAALAKKMVFVGGPRQVRDFISVARLLQEGAARLRRALQRRVIDV